MKNTQTLICPYCKNSLFATEDNSYVCELGHSHDISKEGYLNLLAVNKKKSKLPGDNDLMIAARRAFLDSGHYDPLITTLQTIVTEQSKLHNRSLNILDAGCGEGYYTEKSLNISTDYRHDIIATDISKYAIKIAAKRYKDLSFFVSSIYDLPVADKSIDLVLSVFAPTSPDQFNRVINDQGNVIIVAAGEQHMKEVAELIYDTFRPHNNKVADKMSSLFKLKSHAQCEYELLLNDNDSILNLLKMTPYYWNTSKEILQKFHDLKQLKVTCDFDIHVFQPKIG